MKVCMITSGTKLPVPPVHGGAVQTGIQQIVEENEKHNKLDLTIFSTYDEKAYRESLKYKNTKFYYVKYPKFTIYLTRVINYAFKKIKVKQRVAVNYLFLKKVYSHLKNEKYDFVIVKNNPDYCVRLSKVANVVLQLHNDFLNSETYNRQRIVDSCSFYLTNSEFIKRRLLSIDCVKPTDVYVHYNCLDIEHFTHGNKDEFLVKKVKEKYGINANEKVVLFPGRLIKEKGIKELIIACKKIPNQNFKLVIVGAKAFGISMDNPFLEELKQLVEEVKDQVVFTGYVPYEEMPNIYAIADIVVVPSIWDEPAGRVVIEAQAAKRPVIVSDAGGIPEHTDKNIAIIIERGPEFIDHLASSIGYVLENPKEFEDRARQGVEFVKKFQSQNYYWQLYDILNSRM